jgi:hypothetical protein
VVLAQGVVQFRHRERHRERHRDDEAEVEKELEGRRAAVRVLGVGGTDGPVPDGGGATSDMAVIPSGRGRRGPRR